MAATYQTMMLMSDVTEEDGDGDNNDGDDGDGDPDNDGDGGDADGNNDDDDWRILLQAALRTKSGYHHETPITTEIIIAT